MEEYTNEKEAEDKVEELKMSLCTKLGREKWLKFCPLIKAECEPKCVCFYGPMIVELKYSGNTPNKYRVAGPHCDNAMFTEKEIYYNG